MATAASTTRFLPNVRKAMGAARKMEDSVPKITPRIIAKAKLRMLSPPKKKMQRRTSNVVAEVIIVRAKVSLSESLKRRSVSNAL